MRTPAGVWGDNHPLSAAYSGYADPNPATDGRQYAVVTAPLVGSTKQVLVGIFDPRPARDHECRLHGHRAGGRPARLHSGGDRRVVGHSHRDVDVRRRRDAAPARASRTPTRTRAPTRRASPSPTPRGTRPHAQVPVTIAAQQSTLTAATFSAQVEAEPRQGNARRQGHRTARRHVRRRRAQGQGAQAPRLAPRCRPARSRSRSSCPPSSLPGQLPASRSLPLVPGDAGQARRRARAKLAAPATGVVDVVVLSGGERTAPRPPHAEQRRHDLGELPLRRRAQGHAQADLVHHAQGQEAREPRPPRRRARRPRSAASSS